MERFNSRLQVLKSRKGFTLIELLAVIAIIAILVLIAAPSFLGNKEKAQLAHIKADVKTAQLAVGIHLLEYETLAEKGEGTSKVGFPIYTHTKSEEVTPYNTKGKFEGDVNSGGTLYNVSSIIDSSLNKKGVFVGNDKREVFYLANGKSNLGSNPGSDGENPGSGEGTTPTEPEPIVPVDTDGPTLSLSQSEYNSSTKKVTITATASDISGLKSIKKPNGTTSTLSPTTYVVSTNGTYTFEALDTLNNKTTRSITVSSIPVDTDGPTLSLSQSAYNASTKTVTITATASDMSGLKSIKKPDGTTSTSSPTTYVVSTNRTYTFEALDTLNNKTTRSITVSSVPAVPAPEATITGNTNTVSIINQKYSTVYSVSVETEAPIAFLAYGDNKTKEELKDYSNRMQDWQLSQGHNFSTFNVDIRKNGYYAIYVRDTAGNETYKTYPITMGIGFSENIGYTTVTDLVEFTAGTDGGTKTVSSVKAVRGNHPISYVQSNGVNLLNGHTSVLDTGVNGTHYQVLDFFSRVNGSQDYRQYKYYTLVVTYTNGETVRRLFETASSHL